MRIAIPTEIHQGETRVAATPETIKKLRAGYSPTVMVQAGAGAGANISDQEFEAAGATMVEVRVAGFSGGVDSVTGRLSSIGLPEKKRLSAQSVPTKKTASAATPSTIARREQAPRFLSGRCGRETLSVGSYFGIVSPSKAFGCPGSGGERRDAVRRF